MILITVENRSDCGMQQQHVQFIGSLVSNIQEPAGAQHHAAAIRDLSTRAVVINLHVYAVYVTV